MIEMVSFEDCFNDVTGGNIKIKQVDYLSEGAIPVIDQGKALIGGYTNDKNAIVKCKIPCVIYGDHSRNIKYYDQPFAIGADGVKLLEASERLNPKFGYYFLQTVKLPEGGYDRSFKYLKRISIPIPNLETQNKIVAILDKANNLIQKRYATIEKYYELLRMKFLEIFGDPIFNKKGWNLVPLREVISQIDAGWSPKSEDIARRNSNQLAILKLGAISKRKFDAAQNKLLPPGMKIKRNIQALKGDLLFSRKNTKDLVGATVYIFDDNTNLLLPDTIFNLRYISTKVSGIYLFYLFNDYNFRKSIQQLSSGAAMSMSNISQEKLLSHIIPLPDYNLQIAFDAIVQKTYYKFLEKQENFKKNATNLLTSISQLAFKGELNFNTAVDLEVLLENDYAFFKANSTEQTIQLLLDRLDQNEQNNKKVYEEYIYKKAKEFVFSLLQEGEIKQAFDSKTKSVKLFLA